jgi:hypothetical protein
MKGGKVRHTMQIIRDEASCLNLLHKRYQLIQMAKMARGNRESSAAGGDAHHPSWLASFPNRTLIDPIEVLTFKKESLAVLVTN